MKIYAILFVAVLLNVNASAQRLTSPRVGNSLVPDDVHISILKAEDRRDALAAISLLNSENAATRYRAALAAGRIGDENAVEPLAKLFTDTIVEVQAMAAFALGEIESVKGSSHLLAMLADPRTPDQVRARAVEALGKIAASNASDASSRKLGSAIVDVLRSESERSSGGHPDTIRLAITAILRARPEGGDVIVAKFLKHSNARIRADAANTISRLRSKVANGELRDLLSGEKDVNARANAARALGAAEDKEATELLIEASTKDKEQRVRVSAIRSLAALRETKALVPLVEHGNKLLAAAKRTRSANPDEKTELLEIASAVSRLAPNSFNEKAIGFLESLRTLNRYRSGETEIALATVAPSGYAAEFNVNNNGYADWRVADAYAQGLGSLAASNDTPLKLRTGEALTKFISGIAKGVKPEYQSEMLKAMPALQRANAAFKPDNLNEVLRGLLTNNDVNIRATAAGLIRAQPVSPENIEALKAALSRALIVDRQSDDAQLAMIDALNRLNKKESVGVLLTALNSPNYLVRRRVFQLLVDADLQKEFPGIASSLEKARLEKKDQVLPYSQTAGTRLGQVLNSESDYRRALSRTNGSAKAVFRTAKGVFTISLNGGDAPLTVDNFIKLARSGYFNGAEVHRVVANFVMQDGDPTGTGSGGPGWSIRCEINMAEFDRGSVGMALSGKDTGGSQWFVDHSPQPHLDGGYTVFGRVNDRDMTVVDRIVKGDRILAVRIVGK